MLENANGTDLMIGTTQKRRGGIRRSLAALLPAAIITVGLYLAMDRMIVVEEVELASEPDRVLKTITSQIEESEGERPPRTPPEFIDAVKPPPPPKLGIQRSDINLPVVSLTGGAPAELGFTGLKQISYPPAAIGNRDLVIIRPPVPSYPSIAASRGLEGDCEVRFDVDSRGRPYNVNATCSDAIFKRSAERAVARAEFAPRIVDDQPVERRNVVYPLAFNLS